MSKQLNTNKYSSTLRNIDNFYRSKFPIIFETHNADNEFKDAINTALCKILKNKNLQHLKKHLYFILSEAVENANKANIKRVFFKINGLNINDMSEYDRGMRMFREFICEDPDKLFDYLEKYRMNVEVVFEKYADTGFLVEIKNSSNLTPQEAKRIKDKIQDYKSGSAPEQAFDMAEGAGMGIFLSLQMMERAGIPTDSIEIFSQGNTTVFRIGFGYEGIKAPPYNQVAREILNEIKTLPKYPENIKKMLAKLLQPDVNISEIASDLLKDPALSADILKLVNSAMFATTRKISSIKEALNYIGIKGLKSVLYSYGAMKVINERFGSIPEIWDHCYKTARISEKIARSYLKAKNFDEFFTAGLLHDIGKIVFMSLNKESAEKVAEVCEKKGIYIPVLEEIMMGISHGKIGGEIARIWDFPKPLILAITYHHDPLMAKSDEELVYTTFFANYLSGITKENQLTQYALEPDVRSFFDIKSTEDLINFAHNLRIL